MDLFKARLEHDNFRSVQNAFKIILCNFSQSHGMQWQEKLGVKADNVWKELKPDLYLSNYK